MSEFLNKLYPRVNDNGFEMYDTTCRSSHKPLGKLSQEQVEKYIEHLKQRCTKLKYVKFPENDTVIVDRWLKFLVKCGLKKI